MSTLIAGQRHALNVDILSFNFYSEKQTDHQIHPIE